MDIISISASETQKILSREESHFLDFKGKAIQPNRITKSISAFANADGGELFVGIEENEGSFSWDGFARPEDSNGLIQAIESVLPLGQGCRMEFLQSEGAPGFVLHIEILKSRGIVETSAREVYIRRSASNLPVRSAEALDRLRMDKGLTSFETMTIDAQEDVLTNSIEAIGFMLEIVPHQEPESWLSVASRMIA